MNWFDGKTIAITGAAGGLGTALALELARPGVRLALFDIAADKLAETARQAQAQGAEVVASVVDLSQTDATRQAFAALPASYQSLHVLLVAHGLNHIVVGHDYDPERIRRVMEVNFQGTANAIHAALPGMLAGADGRIGVVASLAGLRGFPLSASYGSSKAAQIHFVESLRLPLAKQGIRTTTILPGFIATDFNNELKEIVPCRLAVTPQFAAKRILLAVAAGRKVYKFPWLPRIAGGFSRLLPSSLFDLLYGNPPTAKLPEATSKTVTAVEPAQRREDDSA